MSGRYVRVVSLWIRPGQGRAFEAFEQDAARIMARHGGRIDSAVRLAAGDAHDSAGSGPFELHVVSFPDRESADSYAADPETAALREGRAGIISKTVVLEGREAGPY